MRAILPLVGVEYVKGSFGVIRLLILFLGSNFLTSGSMFWPPWLVQNIFIHTFPQRVDATLHKISVFQSNCVPRPVRHADERDEEWRIVHTHRPT